MAQYPPPPPTAQEQMQQQGWPPPPVPQFSPGALTVPKFQSRMEQRVHQVAWAVFWLMIANVCGILAAITAVTIVGAFLFGLAAFGFWITALVFSIMALSKT